MYGLKPVPFKDGTLLFLELWSTGFAVISVHWRGMEITSFGGNAHWTAAKNTLSIDQ